MCFAGLPGAVAPLWQLTQAPGVTPVWLNVAGIQAVVLWQLSQEAMVGMCFAGLPVALVPLWHVVHAPGVTPA